MNEIESLMLGIIQGLTEFLPVSSSAHLVITQTFLKLQPGQLILFDLTVHMGTLCAVLIFFRQRIYSSLSASVDLITGKNKTQNSFLLWYLMAATMATAIPGMLIKDTISEFFEQPHIIGLLLICNGALLLATRLRKHYSIHSLDALTLRHAIIIGCFQVLGLFPGISRSGITICAAVYLGIQASIAAEFSFLLAVFAILGAFSVEALQLHLNVRELFSPVYIVGFISAFITGFAAIKLLFQIIRQKRFFYFGLYCIMLGILIMFFIR
ncbi:MAG: undecaprenyl-diphosphate phosphatase [Chlamydiota bacterium]|nr:undecaprenyl-diphosphate phosphatase [Chlamydiota bacterium]